MKTIISTSAILLVLTFSCTPPQNKQQSDEQTEQENVAAKAAKIKGTFTYDYGEKAGNGQLTFVQIDQQTARFALEIIGSGEVPNMGFLQDTLKLEGNNSEAWYTSTEYGGTCQLRFKIAGDQIEIITEQGGSASCGFGNRIIADGIYSKTSEEVSFETY